jgi:AcrR family transcriptional regulator
VSSARSNAEIALLRAAEKCLRRHGLAGLSTRKIAEEAGMPLSQIHYHLGTKRSLLLAVLDFQNEKLLERQQSMFASGQPLSVRWQKACDYLEEDLASGYVRVLQEIIAAGWADPRIASEVKRNLRGWFALLTSVAAEAVEQLGGFDRLEPAEAAALTGSVFLGAEALILLGFTEKEIPLRASLRRVGELLQRLESKPKGASRHARRTARS